MGRGPYSPPSPPGRYSWNRHDFWYAWKEERDRLWEEYAGHPWKPGLPPVPRPLDPGGVWRSFFHEYFGAWPEEHWAFGGRRFSPWHQGQEKFNPFTANLLSKGGGLLPLLVLQQLVKKPLYGNAIMEAIAEGTDGQWETNPGALYPLLTEMEQHGLVVGEWEDPDKRTVRVYRLTDQGQREFVRMRALVRPKLEEAATALKRLIEGLDTANRLQDESPEKPEGKKEREKDG
jgi:DNA-binding PadR family transcriptional regulator